MRVNFYATLRLLVGEKTVEIPLEAGGTITQLVAAIVQAYPVLEREILDERGNLSHHINIIIDGRSAQYLENGMESVLRPEDSVSIFPAVGGG